MGSGHAASSGAAAALRLISAVAGSHGDGGGAGAQKACGGSAGRGRGGRDNAPGKANSGNFRWERREGQHGLQEAPDFLGMPARIREQFPRQTLVLEVPWATQGRSWGGPSSFGRCPNGNGTKPVAAAPGDAVRGSWREPRRCSIGCKRAPTASAPSWWRRLRLALASFGPGRLGCCLSGVEESAPTRPTQPHARAARSASNCACQSATGYFLERHKCRRVLHCDAKGRSTRATPSHDDSVTRPVCHMENNLPPPRCKRGDC